MQFKIKNYTNYIFLFAILLVSAYLYQRYQNKLDREMGSENYDAIQKYLLNDPNLAKDEKPILWIYLDYAYNSRDWLSFGSRSSNNLNQPYLYLTVRTLIRQCEDSFHVVLVDDQSFSKLIPGWSIDMQKISDPVKYYMKELGMSKLLYKYGGMRVPASFVCMRDLNGMYETGTAGNKMFVCEMVNRNITSTYHNFYPSIEFMGAEKGNQCLSQLIDFIQRTISSDYTAQSDFLGEFDRWCNTRIQKNMINLIDGKLIGTKTMEDTPILIDNLLTKDYIDIYSNTYGIYIPADEVLNRVHYEWFARMSPQQVLDSKLIIGKYLLLANAPDARNGVIEPMKNKPNWVSFWKVPSDAPVWGLQPIDLGSNVPRLKHPVN
jgi:glycosyltransferase involved in cell wall biosynthesis